ncbi:MAG: DJ-1/PfpI family protein, partial [Pseudomonadales bacterium]|nr:DJ-1/PfpI family protein [Pseudomonadales bacterium]
MTISVAVFAYDGCFVSGIAGPLDVFNIANTHNRVLNGEDAEPLFSWKVFSQDGKPIKTSTGILVPVQGSMAEISNIDILMLPGIDHCYGYEVIEQAKKVNEAIGDWLVELHGKGTTLASNCSGSFIFAETGLLNGKEATT